MGNEEMECRDAVAGQFDRPVRPLPGGLRLTVIERCELYDWRDECVDAERERCGQVYGSREVAMSDEIRRLAREAHTWSKAAETYAAELERHRPLMQAVEWILEDGHMNQEHLARLRDAWEGA